MVKTRVITALMMLVVMAGLLFFASTQVWLVAVSAMLAWAGVEWANLAHLSKRFKALYAFMLPVLLGLGYALSTVYHYSSQLVFLLCFLTTCFWLLVVPLWLYFGWVVRSKWLLSIVGGLLLLSTGFALLGVRPTAEQSLFLLGLLLVVWVADSVAFFTGRAFGRNKLAPNISPGKTLEGALGAWVGVFIYLAVLVFGLRWLPVEMSLLQVALLAFLLTYVSILGDLFESWLKRCAGVKDSGSSLPGHGGILDRIDAILSTLPLQLVIVFWIFK